MSTPAEIAARNGEAAVDRAIARGAIAHAEAEPWRRMARGGGNPEPALSAMPDDRKQAAANAVAASSSEAPSPELLMALGFPVTPVAPLVGIGSELAQ